jgi:serine/threonine-protein kinase
VAIREKRLPDDWTTFNARSQLGSTLVTLQKYDEAEPLLISGYTELKAREAKIPLKSRARTIEAAGQRILQLYKAWVQPEKAKQWRQRLAPPRRPAKSKN